MAIRSIAFRYFLAASLSTAAAAAPASERFVGTLTGSAAVPPNASAATGSATVTVEDSGAGLEAAVAFSGLSSGFAHVELHGPAAEGATAPQLALLVDGTMDMGTGDGGYGSGYGMGPGMGTPRTSGSFPSVSLPMPAGSLDDLRAGRWYVVVTTNAYPAGEIRGQLAPAAFSITPGLSGSWFDQSAAGHGFQVAVLPTTPPQLLVFWFVFAPNGGQAWVVGQGEVAGNRAVLQAFQTLGSGGRFPPHFDPSAVQSMSWGTLTFTFFDCTHGHVDYVSGVPAFGSGSFDIERLTTLAGLSCP